jgi:hypothetical protein
MKSETADVELARLRKEQKKTRQDEIFGGLTDEERSAYENKAHRIRQLEFELSGRNGGFEAVYP